MNVEWQCVLIVYLRHYALLPYIGMQCSHDHFFSCFLVHDSESYHNSIQDVSRGRTSLRLNYIDTTKNAYI
jgi:hypothetical protein